MMTKTWLAVASLSIATGAFAQSGTMMTGEQLTELTKGGVSLQLGGDGAGYKGTLDLAADGTAKGGATTDGGDKIEIAGSWVIKGDSFCRTWEKLDGGNEVCETWYLTSERSAEVYNGTAMIGLNAW